MRVWRSHVEPPLSRDWTDLCMAEWMASLLEHETGLRVLFGPGGVTRNGRAMTGWVGVIVGSTSTAMPITDLWGFLNDVSLGAKEAQRVRLPELLELALVKGMAGLW